MLTGSGAVSLDTERNIQSNHTHPYDQFTVLLGGSTMVVKEIDDQLIEYPIAENIVHVTPKGITHILVPLDDAILYEWRQGPFEAEPCPGVFEEYTKTGNGLSD